MNTQERDTVVVVGPSASGKTATLNIIRDYLASRGIPFIMGSHTDAHTILEWMALDDARGGRNHYHPWCPGSEAHDHDHGEPTRPFTVTGNFIAHGMMKDFFEGLVRLQHDGRIHLAEWSGGVNTNPETDPASRTDLSFETIGRMLADGSFPNKGLERIFAVIHPATKQELRVQLNEQRHHKQIGEHEIALGMASWPLDEAGLRIFGEDDFEKLLPLFESFGIPHVFSIENDGIPRPKEGVWPFEEAIKKRLSDEVFSSFPPRQEGRSGIRREAQ